MERSEFLKRILFLGEIFEKTPSALVLDGYYEALKDISDTDLDIAFKRALVECKFFPKPVELRELAGITTSVEAIDAEAELAFEHVYKHIGKYGSWYSINFGREINGVIEGMGGWELINLREEEEFLVWGRKEFKDIFKARRRGRVQGSERLLGIHDRSNLCAGYIEQKDVKIIDAQLKPTRILKALPDARGNQGGIAKWRVNSAGRN